MRLPTLCVTVSLATFSMVAVTATSCSSSGSNKSASSGGGAAVSTAPSTAAAAKAGSGGGKATCSPLTIAQVQPLVVKPITKVTSAAAPLNVSLHGLGQMCTFATSSTESAITVTVVGGQDAANYYLGQVQGITPVSVSGIGDKAVRDGGHGSSTITAEAGGVTCSVSTSAEDNLPGVGALEDAAGNTSEIGDANYAVISTALGTLCNRIFCSGNTTPSFSGLSTPSASATPEPIPTGLITS
jgi:hypothetical protein